MSTDRPLRVVFLWHQHQPYYIDFETGRAVLPWVRLHGVKDYLDMVRILDEFPTLKQTFNLVPSLIEQIESYVSGEVIDNQMALTLKRASELSESDKLEITQSFFSASAGTMIKPLQRYYQLYQKVLLARSDLSRVSRDFSEQDWIDLVILSNLTWIDPMFRDDPEIKYLFDKKRDYSEGDKANLWNFHKKILAQILPAHQEAQDRGLIEVSFSPYYHPILPLLIDTDLAKESMPHSQLPNQRFSHPEDAERQIQMSSEMYEDRFGRPMRGMWPSEGSVAEALLPVLINKGVEWIATDQEIWEASLSDGKRSGSTFHQPFVLRRESGEVGIIFRDHTMSDKIGFVYSGWDAQEAAADFIKSLHNIRKVIGPEHIDEAIVPVILDGENAWEYYHNDGSDFLRALYKQIQDDPTITTETVSGVFDKKDKAENIPRLFAGSWIDHNFRIWIGHEEDNKAWDLLSAARSALVEYELSNTDADSETLARAWQRIYIAEGSDWCWWYGDEHSSDQDDVFDRLFRSHLTAVYSLIGKEPPPDLMKPIRGVRGISGIEQPLGLISPEIDGVVTDYYEWYSAGIYNCMKAGSAMHRAVNVLHAYYFGFDDDNIYLRLDLFTRAHDDSAGEFAFRFLLTTVKRYRFDIDQSGITMWVGEGDDFSKLSFSGKVGIAKLIEVSIPRQDIEFDSEFRAQLAVEVLRGDEQIERWPSYDWVRTTMPTEDKSTFWQV
jgi:alpha-amylase/alpha-mannosidase (GH57 family)